MALSPITTDILLGAVKLGARPPEEFPLFLAGKKVEPKLTQRREVVTKSGLGYILNARTDYEGKGKLTIYEVNGKRRQKAAELTVRSLSDVSDKFGKIVEIIDRETTVMTGRSILVKRTETPPPPFVPRPQEPSSAEAQAVKRPSMEEQAAAEEAARVARLRAEDEARRREQPNINLPPVSVTPHLVRNRETGQMEWYPHPPTRR